MITIALVAFIIPMVAVGVGSFRGEPLTLRTLLGGALVLGGVALATQFASRIKGKRPTSV